MLFGFEKAKKFARQLREARKVGKKPSFGRLVDIVKSGLRYRLSPLEYYLYGFDADGITRKKRFSYLSNERIVRIFRPALNNRRWISVLENKLLFFHYYSQFKLPVVNVYGFYYPDRGFFLDGTSLRGKDDFVKWIKKSGIKDLVVKPVGSLGGKGIKIFTRVISPELALGNDGKEYTLGEIFSFMDNDITARQPREDPFRGYIIEAKISQDPVMNVLSGASLNTIRVSTIITKHNEVLIDFAMIRMGKAGSLTDNLHQGGYVVNIQIEKGELDEKTFGYRGEEGPWIEEKEQKVKQLFTKGRIPYWDAIVSLVKKTAALSPELRSVGWDIALSKDGPVLMEGNDNWDMVIAQVLAGGYLTERRREILRAYGLEFPM